MADWDRSSVVKAPPTATTVYPELGAGCGAAFLLTGLLGGGGLISGLFAMDVVSAVGAGNSLLFVLLTATVFGIGLVQWLWLAPLAVAAYRRRPAFALGLVIGGVVIAMLNGTCVATFAGASF